jgi:hypothetical protein
MSKRRLEHDERLNIRLPAPLARTATRKAKAEHRSLSDVIRELLRSWLAQQS